MFVLAWCSRLLLVLSVFVFQAARKSPHTCNTRRTQSKGEAFDSLCPEVAAVSFNTSGVPPGLFAVFSAVPGRVPGSAMVHGAIAKRDQPMRGVPQGDPI